MQRWDDDPFKDLETSLAAYRAKKKKIVISWERIDYFWKDVVPHGTRGLSVTEDDFFELECLLRFYLFQIEKLEFAFILQEAVLPDVHLFGFAPGLSVPYKYYDPSADEDDDEDGGMEYRSLFEKSYGFHARFSDAPQIVEQAPDCGTEGQPKHKKRKLQKTMTGAGGGGVPVLLVPSAEPHLCSVCGWMGHNKRGCAEEWEELTKNAVSESRIREMREEGKQRLERRVVVRKANVARRARLTYKAKRRTSLFLSV